MQRLPEDPLSYQHIHGPEWKVVEVMGPMNAQIPRYIHNTHVLCTLCAHTGISTMHVYAQYIHNAYVYTLKIAQPPHHANQRQGGAGPDQLCMQGRCHIDRLCVCVMSCKLLMSIDPVLKPYVHTYTYVYIYIYTFNGYACTVYITYALWKYVYIRVMGHEVSLKMSCLTGDALHKKWGAPMNGMSQGKWGGPMEARGSHRSVSKTGRGSEGVPWMGCFILGYNVIGAGLMEKILYKICTKYCKIFPNTRNAHKMRLNTTQFY